MVGNEEFPSGNSVPKSPEYEIKKYASTFYQGHNKNLNVYLCTS
jgi:hypothetical protein